MSGKMWSNNYTSLYLLKDDEDTDATYLSHTDIMEWSGWDLHSTQVVLETVIPAGIDVMDIRSGSTLHVMHAHRGPRNDYQRQLDNQCLIIRFSNVRDIHREMQQVSTFDPNQQHALTLITKFSCKLEFVFHDEAL